jgi:hypothetical protein
LLATGLLVPAFPVLASGIMVPPAAFQADEEALAFRPPREAPATEAKVPGETTGRKAAFDAFFSSSGAMGDLLEIQTPPDLGLPRRVRAVDGGIGWISAPLDPIAHLGPRGMLTVFPRKPVLVFGFLLGKGTMWFTSQDGKATGTEPGGPRPSGWWWSCPRRETASSRPTRWERSDRGLAPGGDQQTVFFKWTCREMVAAVFTLR